MAKPCNAVEEWLAIFGREQGYAWLVGVFMFLDFWLLRSVLFLLVVIVFSVLSSGLLDDRAVGVQGHCYLFGNRVDSCQLRSAHSMRSKRLHRWRPQRLPLLLRTPLTRIEVHVYKTLETLVDFKLACLTDQPAWCLAGLWEVLGLARSESIYLGKECWLPLLVSSLQFRCLRGISYLLRLS